MLTKTQLKRIQKAMNNGTGVDLKISKTQIRHLVQEGGSLLSSLLTLGTKALPYATKAVSKVVPALATGAVQALGSLGVDKIFGKGQSGGFLIPQDKIDQLIKYKDLLTKNTERTDCFSYSYRRSTRYKANKNTVWWLSRYIARKHRSAFVAESINRKRVTG